MTARKRNKRGALLVPVVLLLLGAMALGGIWAVRHGLIPRGPKPLAYKREILEAAHTYGLSPCFVAAVICTESGFDKDAVSADGAEGLMQVLPSTAEWICTKRGMGYEPERLFEPEYSIDMGCWLLRFLMDRYDGSERYAAIAYNAGHGRLESWLENPEYLDEEGELAVIPFGETSAYVRKIELRKEQYLRLYGEELENAKE